MNIYYEDIYWNWIWITTRKANVKTRTCMTEITIGSIAAAGIKINWITK